MRTQPVAISVGVSAILLIAINAAIDLLSDVDWKMAAVRALTAAAVLVGGGKVAHDNAYAADTVSRIRRNAERYGRPAHVPDAGNPPIRR